MCLEICLKQHVLSLYVLVYNETAYTVCVCVCVCACMRACVRACACVCVGGWVRVCVCACMCICGRVCSHRVLSPAEKEQAKLKENLQLNDADTIWRDCSEHYRSSHLDHQTNTSAKSSNLWWHQCSRSSTSIQHGEGQ